MLAEKRTKGDPTGVANFRFLVPVYCVVYALCAACFFGGQVCQYVNNLSSLANSKTVTKKIVNYK